MAVVLQNGSKYQNEKNYDKLLVQEMEIINNILCQNIFTIVLRIQHDFAKLEQITYELRKIIDGYNCR